MKNQQLKQVVMLPTNEASPIIRDFNNKLILNYNNTQNLRNGYIFQHLYFIDNSEIKEGDWFLTDIRLRKSDNNGVPIWKLLQCTSITNSWIESSSEKGVGFNPNWSKKIVATTDKSLNLPQISESFLKVYIDSYNAGKPITEVNLEYEKLSPMQEMLIKENYVSNNTFIPKLKLREDNTIIVSPSKTYTREEVCQIIYNYSNFICDTNCPSELQDGTTSWIEQNL